MSQLDDAQRRWENDMVLGRLREEYAVAKERFDRENYEAKEQIRECHRTIAELRQTIRAATAAIAGKQKRISQLTGMTTPSTALGWKARQVRAREYLVQSKLGNILTVKAQQAARRTIRPKPCKNTAPSPSDAGGQATSPTSTSPETPGPSESPTPPGSEPPSSQ